MPKVSIIIPVFNVQEYLRECMDSVLAQTLKDIEIICVNDGSTDCSPEILEGYAAIDSRVRVLHKENTGYGASMNRGIEEAVGEYIGIVEPDDFVEAEMFEELYQTAGKFQLDWVKGDFQVFKGNGEDRRYSVVRSYLPGDQKVYHHVIKPKDYPELILYDDFHWKGIYKKEFLCRNHIKFNETPGAAYQDNGFKYQTICMAERVMYMDKAYYWYRRDNPSASSNNARGLELMYGEYEFIRDFMDRNQERTKEFRTVYYRKFFSQLHDQLGKILDREWEESQPGEILDKYRMELNSGFEQGYLSGNQIEQWLYFDIRFFLEYPRSYFECKKVQREIETEKYVEWLGFLKDKKVVLVCSGIKARQVINFVDTNQYPPCIVAVCDNNESMWGKSLYGYTISSIAQAVKKYPEGYFLVAKAGETQELREQLLKLGIREGSIGNVSIALSSFSSLRRVV